MKIVFNLLIVFNVLFSENLNMNLVGFYPFDQDCSDITGFESHGREIAVIGLYNGTAFVDITNPQNPLELQIIDGIGSIWRDVKYWDNHVYIGTEAEMGVQVVDVSDLENIHLVYTITDFDDSHNIHVWEGNLFVIGADIHDIWIYDLSEPNAPNLVGFWEGEYLHDIDVYNNKIYGTGIYSSTVYIIDITDITSPTTIVSWNYPGMAHDAAVFHNEQFLATADEMQGGHLKIWDISDYDNISEVSSFQINETHSLHNIYFKNDLIIGSWYADGTRVLDVSDPYNLVEIGFYDTTELEGLYVGNWGTYVYLPSGLIISSDTESGLYILEMDLVVTHEELSEISLNQDIPIDITILSPTSDITTASVYYKEYFGEWNIIELENCSEGNNNYCNFISSFNFNTIFEYYIYVENSNGQSVLLPSEGEDNPFSVTIGDIPIIIEDNIENSTGWIIGDELDNATMGIWEFGDPNPVLISSSNTYSQPENDNTIDGVNCFITGNSVGENEGFDDVDGGKTTLISPVYSLEDADEILFQFSLWYSNNLGDNPGTDFLTIDYRQDIMLDWLPFYSTNFSTEGWETKQFYLSEITDNFSQIQFRIIASDLMYENDSGSGGSLIEAGIDDLIFKSLYSNILLGDANLDGNIDITDIITMVNFIIGVMYPDNQMILNSDIDGNGLINIIDLVSVVNIILY